MNNSPLPTHNVWLAQALAGWSEIASADWLLRFSPWASVIAITVSAEECVSIVSADIVSSRSLEREGVRPKGHIPESRILYLAAAASPRCAMCSHLCILYTCAFCIVHVCLSTIQYCMHVWPCLVGFLCAWSMLCVHCDLWHVSYRSMVLCIHMYQNGLQTVHNTLHMCISEILS